MTRDEAKKLMRLELEQDVPSNVRQDKVFSIRDRMLSANDLMEEIEADTDLGKYLLDDFILFKNGVALTAIERLQVIGMMEKDMKISPTGWADEVIYQQDGKSWTPNQIMAEVRSETDFGLRYMQLYHANHKLLQGILGEDYDKEIGSFYAEDIRSTNLFGLDANKKNDKAN